MSDELVNLKVPRRLAEKLNEKAKRKDRLKTWAGEAREILEREAAEDTAQAQAGAQ